MNGMYGKGREAFGDGDLSWRDDNIKVVAVDTDDYTADLDIDQYLSDIPSGARISTSSNLANKTNTLGVMDADDVVLPSVTGDEFEALVIYQDSGDPETSRLILYIDTVLSGLPQTPVGNNITVTWNSEGIFKL